MPGITAPKKRATPAQKQWNGGESADPLPGRPIGAPGSCTTPHCGAVADSVNEADPALSGWTRAGVYGSTEPDRVWCSGQCAAYGIALAEVRMGQGASGA